WSLGYPAQASAKSSEAIALAEETSHPHSLAYATVYGCLIDQFCGRVPDIREKAERAIVISTEHVLPIWAAAATVFHGWALTREGRMANGLEEMLRGMSTWQAIGAEKSRTFFLELLAEVQLRAGNFKEGLSTLAEMSTAMEKTNERFREAELH